MEKLNIAEILKDCPKGMELDCTLFEGLEFDCIVDNEYLPIRCRIKHPNGGYTVYNFTKYGCWLDTTFAKCVIFPKGKTTWEGFQRPFKDGDILTYTSNHTTTFIYRNKDNEPNFSTSFYVACNNAPSNNFLIYNKYTLIALNENCDVRFATEEEKQKLFDAIKANGYKWNSETKTLEKLEVNKFDITTLKPFDKVLVRQNDYGKWGIDFFGFYAEGFYYTTGSAIYVQCVPYRDNEHLCGTTNDCDDFYKTWE